MAEHIQSAASRGNINRLLVKIREERGLDLLQYRVRYVERRVAVRLNLLGIHTYQQYAAYLDSHPEEYGQLMDTLTVNVTQFFRDSSVYELFQSTVVPQLLAQKAARGQRLVRVWSAGCATGEEPYSLAMAFLDGIRVANADKILLTVIGTDMDDHALSVGKRGVYPVGLLDQIPISTRARYVDAGTETFRMRPDVMKVVRFQHLNLFDQAPIHGVDVIFCRNVFIYFNREQQERMIDGFKHSLTRGGFLVLGRSERLSAETAKQFEVVSGRERVYRKPFALQPGARI